MGMDDLNNQHPSHQTMNLEHSDVAYIWIERVITEYNQCAGEHCNNKGDPKTAPVEAFLHDRFDFRPSQRISVLMMIRSLNFM